VLVGPFLAWKPPSEPWKKNSAATKTTAMVTSFVVLEWKDIRKAKCDTILVFLNKEIPGNWAASS
jgi:hypothetical protein